MKLPKPPKVNHTRPSLQTQLKVWKMKNAIAFETQSNQKGQKK